VVGRPDTSRGSRTGARRWGLGSSSHSSGWAPRFLDEVIRQEAVVIALVSPRGIDHPDVDAFLDAMLVLADDQHSAPSPTFLCELGEAP
jgi:hypothetical protein